MSAIKNVIDILDLSAKEIDSLMDTAEEMAKHPEKYEDALRHRTLAALFFEPSTRTRLSFESAMLSLGGNVIGFSDAGTSSTTKGESLADTVKVVSGYADIIAMRHPKEGATAVACEHAYIPVINAGDGGHYHPTQTLADLLTIRREKGRLDHLTVGICGDLRYGRTVHSLIDAMARYEDVRFVLISPRELALPDFVLNGTLQKNHIPYIESTSLEEVIGTLDVLYMTRVQKERFDSAKTYERLKDVYILTAEKLRAAKTDMIILHPLPRVNEIATEIDSDPRACYFRQTVNGKLMRMALILKLLSEKDLPDADRRKGISCDRAGAVCTNPHCIVSVERNLPPRFYRDTEGRPHCAYCDAEVTAQNTSRTENR